MKKISQREALRLRKRVAEFERIERARHERWGSTYPGGVHIATIPIAPEAWNRCDVARTLDHTLVVTVHTTNEIRVYAVKS